MELSGRQSLTPFGTLCGEFLAEEYAAAPVLASGLGLTEFDGRLDDLSAGAFERRLGQSAQWQARFRAVPEAGLSPDERIDRDFPISILTGRTIMGDWAAWRRQPELYVGPGPRAADRALHWRGKTGSGLDFTFLARAAELKGSQGLTPKEPK